MIEIERKFLVLSKEFIDTSIRSYRIVQGFLNTDPERTVRIRIKDKQAFITVKGISNSSGTTRFEWEKEIPVTDAEKLLVLCKKGIIEKIRYEVPAGTHTYEIDEFFDENKGLIIAEIELSNEQEKFEKPNWLGKEVTGEAKYYNSQLSKHPFKKW